MLVFFDITCMRVVYAGLAQGLQDKTFEQPYGFASARKVNFWRE